MDYNELTQLKENLGFILLKMESQGVIANRKMIDEVKSVRAL
jgi:hypothetical protein